MKKLSLFVAPIMAASFLIGCGGGGNKPEAPEFSIDNVEVAGEVAIVKIEWTPSEDKIKFADFSYKGDEATAEQTSEDYDRPCVVKITFQDDITTEKSGALQFNYEDETSGVKAIGESIPITIPAPDPYKVNETEFNAALGFDGVSYLQVQDKSTNVPVDYEISPNRSYSQEKFGNAVVETYVDNDSGQYNRYFRQREEDNFICIENVEDTELLTPKSDDVIASLKISQYELEYKDFTYDKNTKAYKAHHEDSGNDFTLYFENLKLMHMVISSGQEYVYTYNETVPTLPNVQVFNELSLPTGDDPISDYIEIDDGGRIYIEFTNAANYLKAGTKLSIQCFLPGEDLSSSQINAYSDVYGYYGRLKDETINFNTSVDVTNNKQLWSYTVTKDFDTDCYLTIVLNKNFVGPTTGRTMKTEFTDPVGCYLSKGDGLYAFGIDFTNISDEA